MRTKRHTRGQTLVLFAITFLALSVMIFMTLAVTARLRRKMELQTAADTAAYTNAVVTARAYNAMSMLNRASVSHWVVLGSIQAELAYATLVPAYLDAYAAGLTRLLEYPQLKSASGALLPTRKLKDQDICALTEAADLFYHAEHSYWSTTPGVGDKDLNHLAVAGHANRLSMKLGRGPLTCPGPFLQLHHRPMGQSFDGLDREVGFEAKAVRQAIQDLTQAQQGLYCQLLTSLGATGVPAESIPGASCPKVGALAESIASSSSSGSRYAITAPTFSTVGPSPSYLPSYVPPAAQDALASIARDRRDALQVLHTSMATRGRHFPVGGEQDWDDGNPTADFYRSPIPPNLMQQVETIRKYLNTKYGGFYLKNRDFLIQTLFDDGSDLPKGGVGAPLTVDLSDGGLLTIDAGLPEANFAFNESNRTPPGDVFDALAIRASGISGLAAKVGYAYKTPNLDPGNPGTLTTYYGVPVETTVREYSDISSLPSGIDPHMSIHEWNACDSSGVCARGGGIVPNGTCKSTVSGDRGGYWACWLYGKQGEGVPNYGKNPWFPFYYGDEGDPAYPQAHVFGDEAKRSNHFLGALVPETGVPTPDPGGMGILPGGFSFIFPQKTGGLTVRGARGAFGQPKSPVLLTRNNTPTGALDPWDLKFTLNSGPVSQSLDLTASTSPQLALGTAITYYHRRRERHDPLSWMETGNLLAPFWHATLVPINVDENPADPTPGLVPDTADPAGAIRTLRRVSGAARAAAVDAAGVYQALKAQGYRGIQ
jgi:hypothetical protein